MRSHSRGTVLHFIDTTGPGGGETIFLQVAAAMRERGWVSRTLLVGPGWVLDHVNALDLPVDLVETQGRLDLGYLRRIVQLVGAHDVDLIHAHLFSPAVYASVVGAWTGVPIVATFHGGSDAERGGMMRTARYRLVDRRAAIVCVSDSLRADVASLPGIRSQRVRVIHNGVDWSGFADADGSAVRREHGIADDVLLIGAVGNVRPAKDYPTLLRTAAELTGDRRFVFAIVGEQTDPLYTELLRLRDELGLAERVSFWGFRRDVPEIMAAFDTLLISSSTEGFSLAAIQAMASGTPVVATCSGGPQEIITDGADGLLVPVGDPKALADAVRCLHGDRALRERVIANARNTVRQRFSLSTMLDRYESLYEELLGLARGSSVSSRVAQPSSLL